VSSYAEILIDRFRSKGVLVDTNLLLLYVVGGYDDRIVQRGSFNRLTAYSVEDYSLLRGLMSLFDKYITTPHVLAEVSNWIGKLPRSQEIECLGRFADILSGFTELAIESFEVALHPRFAYLGLTDAVIAKFASEYLVLTDDARFVVHLNEMGLDALNINHIRQEVWLRDQEAVS
jgi:hypothetical protein